MGYRSEIQMVIIGPEDVIVSKWARLMMENPWSGDGKDPLRDTSGLTISKNGSDAVICMYGASWKWYGSYPDVQRFEFVWDSYQELYESKEPNELPGSDKVRGAFVRIGEDDDDIEIRSFGEDGFELVQVSRTIHSDYSLAPDSDIRSYL